MEGFKNYKYSDGFFNVTPANGFLPVNPPMEHLPSEYDDLEYIASNLHKLIKFDNLDDYVTILPNYIDSVKHVTDPQLLQALYRAYTFIVSAYLLLPSYKHYVAHGTYGKARTSVPSNLSIPLFCVSEKLDVAPYLDYHYAYCLGNYRLIDSSKPMEWNNLEMIVKFDGGLDERGFVMVHVDINTLGKYLLEGINNVYTGIKTSNICSVVDGLYLNYMTMKSINARRKEMWKASDYKNYNNFRVFIMGIEGNNKIFGEDGVVYEGVNEEPLKFRGQTGAQDDIIPCEDIFSGVINYYPENDLTRYLLDLRRYRPKCVQLFFKDLEETSKLYNLLDLDKLGKTGDEELVFKSYVYLLGIVDEIFNFRNGHWQFVQKFIMKNTTYAVATGGTPITTWIPNQMLATLNYMDDIIKKIRTLGEFNDELFVMISSNYVKKRQILEEQINELHKQIYSVDKIIDSNKEFTDDQVSLTSSSSSTSSSITFG